jgi:hypothetical protein
MAVHAYSLAGGWTSSSLIVSQTNPVVHVYDHVRAQVLVPTWHPAALQRLQAHDDRLLATLERISLERVCELLLDARIQ